MAVERSDTFSRANTAGTTTPAGASGWGTSSGGDAWGLLSGVTGSGTYSIASNEGKYVGTSGTSQFCGLGSAISGVDVEVLARFTCTAATADAWGILCRASDNQNYMLLRVLNSSGWKLNLLSKLANVTKTNASASIGTPASGTKYWLRLQFIGSTVNGKFWQDGTAEPTSWTVTATDANFSSAGLVGIYMFMNTGTENVQWDSFSATDMPVTSTRTAPASAALLTTRTRTAPAHAALLTTLTRTVPTSAAIASGVSSATRTVPTAAAILATGARTAPEHAALLTTLSRSIPTSAALLATLSRTIPTSAAISIAGKASGATTTGTGTGPATMAADTTHSVSWTSSSGGAGSGTETDIVSANASGDGWAFGSLPSYGGMPFSAWFERAANAVVNSGMNSVNPGSNGSMGTSISDGVGIHLQYSTNNGSSFHGSEEIQSWTRSELAPTQTAVRRRIRATGTDVPGLSWTITATVWPGDPGLVFYKVTATNSSGSTITPTGSGTSGFIVASPAGLLSSTGSSADQGPWVADSSHVRKGTVSTLTAAAVPTSAASGEPDALMAIPAAGIGSLSTPRLAVGTVKFTKMADAGLFSASSVQHVADQNTSRTKLYWACTPAAIANGGTGTWYLLQFLRGSATDADMLAIAADYLQPGSPTVSVGTLTTFNYPNHTSFGFNLDEGCYEIAASANKATITLDLSVGTQANVRYKPRFKITGLLGLIHADGSEVAITWGGSALVAGTDYNIAVDTATGIAYVALQFDVVASGATTGQRNSAALALVATPTHTVPDTAALRTTGARAIPVAAALLASPARTIPTSAALRATNTRTVPTHAALTTTGTGTVPSRAALKTTAARTVPASATISGVTARSVPTSAALRTTRARAIPTGAALRTTGARAVPTAAALTAAQANTRTVPTAAAILAAPRTPGAPRAAIAEIAATGVQIQEL